MSARCTLSHVTLIAMHFLYWIYYGMEYRRSRNIVGDLLANLDSLGSPLKFRTRSADDRPNLRLEEELTLPNYGLDEQVGPAQSDLCIEVY